MPENPKVSILIPSYNHARFLPAAIESVLAQTYPNIELIIVDDGSKDQSLSIAEGYAAKHPTKVRVFTHPNHANRGISATVNEGFNRSTGDFFSGLPSDDMLMPDKVEQQLRFLQRHPDIGWVYATGQCVDEDGNPLGALFGHDISQQPRPIEKLIIVNSVPGMTVLARRECFEQVGLHTENLLYSDWEFWVRMASHFKVGYMDKKVVKFRVHDYNTSVGITRDQELNRGLEVMTSLRRNENLFGGELATGRVQALIESQRYQYLFCLGRLEESSRSLLSVFETYPAIQDKPKLFEDWLRAGSRAASMPEYYQWTLEQLPVDLKEAFRRKISRRLKALTLAAEAQKCHKAGDFQKTRRLAIQSILDDPARLTDRPLMSALIETLVGSPLMGLARNLKRQIAGKLNSI